MVLDLDAVKLVEKLDGLPLALATAGAYLFLPLVWPHGPIGHLGGPAPGVSRQWSISGAGPPRTA